MREYVVALDLRSILTGSASLNDAWNARYASIEMVFGEVEVGREREVWRAKYGWMPDAATLDAKYDKLRVWVEVLVCVCVSVGHVVLIL